jgi:predicted nucleic acid-binding protein
MANEVTPIRSFEPKGSHTYLLDTNILIYLYSPISSYDEKNQEVAGKFLENCRRVNSTVVTTSSVLSEFFHVNLKLYHDSWSKEQTDSTAIHIKKHYRSTSHYQESVESIQAKMNGILKICHRVDDGFQNIDVDSVIQGCLHSEFYDSYFIEMANKNNWYIVSNDNDILRHPQLKSNVLIFS